MSGQLNKGQGATLFTNIACLLDKGLLGSLNDYFGDGSGEIKRFE
jgi:hypothetical protein